jgi:hypothetical protein
MRHGPHYAEAITPLRESTRRGPQVLLGHVWLAAALVRLGQRTEEESSSRGS